MASGAVGNTGLSQAVMAKRSSPQFSVFDAYLRVQCAVVITKVSDEL